MERSGTKRNGTKRNGDRGEAQRDGAGRVNGHGIWSGFGMEWNETKRNETGRAGSRQTRFSLLQLLFEIHIGRIVAFDERGNQLFSRELTESGFTEFLEKFLTLQ